MRKMTLKATVATAKIAMYMPVKISQFMKSPVGNQRKAIAEITSTANMAAPSEKSLPEVLRRGNA